jgi:hypothetical protein
MSDVMDTPRTTSEKVALLRRLVDDVGVLTQQELASRWRVTREAVRQMLSREDAPTPLLSAPRGYYYILPEVEAYRSRRLLKRDENAQG